MSQYNLRNPAVKRLMREAKELKYPTAEYDAQPVNDNLFEWHFTLSGPPNTEFEGGVYHGRIILPPDYPMKPPSIMLLTPNGRFETNKKICLSISGYPPESWKPSWSIKTALLALIGFLPTPGNGAIGSLDYTPEERKELALKSQNWDCPQCGLVKQYLADKEIKSGASSSTPEIRVYSLNQMENTTRDSAATSNNPSRIKTKREDKLVASSTIKENSNASVSTRPMSRSEECLLRHRQQVAKHKMNHRWITSEMENTTRDSAATSINPSRLKTKRVDKLVASSTIKENSNALVSTRPMSRSEECLLRHRQQVAKHKMNQRVIASEVTSPFGREWSLYVMWIIAIFLGFLKF